MTVSYIERPDLKTIELSVNGRVTKADYDAVVGPMQDFIDAHGTVKLLEVVESLQGFDASMLLPGIRFDIRNLRHISHVAVVTDIGWIGPITRMAGAFMSTQLKIFPLDQVDAARAWLADPDNG